MPGPLHIIGDVTPALRPSRPAKWVAETIGEDLTTIYRLLRTGQIEGYNGGAKGGSVMVFLDSVAAYQASRRIGGAEPAKGGRHKPKPSSKAHNQAVSALRDAGIRI